MIFRETEFDNIKPGSLWKHIFTERENPNVETQNPDYLVGRVVDGEVMFGPNPRNSDHHYRPSKFMSDLVPLVDPEIKLKVGTVSILTPLSLCPELYGELQAMIVEMEI